jgi:probable F420-dependent oxidoreductase
VVGSTSAFEGTAVGRYGSAVAVHVGIGLFTGQIPSGSSRTFAREYRETLDLVRLAEAVGFDSAWVSEHHGSSDGYLPSLLPMLAAFAASTDRMALGTGIVLAPFHDPLRLAEDAAVVDQLSGGRLVLGLGIGWRDEEFRMFGVPKSERGRRTEEIIQVLRLAWTGRRFSFEGRSFQLDQVKVTPTPAREAGIPIYLGGYAEPAVRRAGRLADGYITDADATDEVAPMLAHFDAAARQAGRDPDELGVALIRNAFVTRNGDDAWQVIGPGVAHQVGTYSAWEGGADTPEDDQLVPQPPDEQTMRGWTPSGTPEHVTGALRPLVDAFGHLRLDLIVRLHYPGMGFETAAKAVELFGEEVLPALKGA